MPAVGSLRKFKKMQTTASLLVVLLLALVPYIYAKHELFAIGEHVKYVQPIQRFDEFPSSKKWTQIATGFDHTLLLTSDGQIYGYGFA